MGSKRPQGHGIPKWMPFSCHRNLTRCRSNCNVYMQKKDGSLLLIVLYVDDFLITSSSVAGLRSNNSALNKALTMTDLGLLRQFIGLEVSQNTSGIMISQSRYSSYMLKIFHMGGLQGSAVSFSIRNQD